MEKKDIKFDDIGSTSIIHEVMDDMVGCWRTQLVYVAIKSNILRYISDYSIMSIEKLEELTKINREGIMRLISALNSLQYIKLYEENVSLTKKGQILLNMFPNAATMWGSTHYHALGQLYESLVENKPMGTSEFNRNFFYFLDSEALLTDTHQKAFAEYASYDYPLIAEKLSVTPGMTIVDLGGGLGILLNFIMKRTPKIRGIVIDLPNAIEFAKTQAQESKIEFIPGDFFKPIQISEEVDMVIMSRILHDWDDGKAGQILESAKKMIKSDGKISIVEHIRPSTLEKDTVALLNLHMYCISNGKERTLSEFEKLFDSVGLKIKNIETSDFLSILTVGN